MKLGTDEQSCERRAENDNSRAVILLQLSPENKLQVEEIMSVNIEMFKSCIQCFNLIQPAAVTWFAESSPDIHEHFFRFRRER